MENVYVSTAHSGAKNPVFRISFPVYARRVDSSALVFSLSSYRHSYIGLVFTSRFID